MCFQIDYVICITSAFLSKLSYSLNVVVLLLPLFMSGKLFSSCLISITGKETIQSIKIFALDFQGERLTMFIKKPCLSFTEQS